MSEILEALDKVLAERKKEDQADQSYVAQLHQKGLNKILEKVGEEATEAILAAKDAALSGDNKLLVQETADLWFHCMVMLSHLNSDASAVTKELERRFSLSGLSEKASRSQT